MKYEDRQHGGERVRGGVAQSQSLHPQVSVVEEVDCSVQPDREKIDDCGSPRVLHGVEGPEEELKGTEREQSQREQLKHARQQLGALGAHHPSLEEQSHDRHRQGQVAERRGDHDEGGAPDALAELEPERRHVPIHPSRGHRGEKRRGDGDHEDGVRKLEEDER